MKKMLNGFPHDSDVVRQAQEVIRIEEKKKMFRAHSLFDSFRYAIEGLLYAVKTQRNVRIHLFAFTVVLVAGLLLHLRTIDMAIVLLASIAVVFAEMVNTALELVLDMVNGTRYHPTVKIIKDLSAAGVLIAALGAFIIGILIFSRYIPILVW